MAFQHPTAPGRAGTPGTTLAGHGGGEGAACAGAAAVHSPAADMTATSAARSGRDTSEEHLGPPSIVRLVDPAVATLDLSAPDGHGASA